MKENIKSYDEALKIYTGITGKVPTFDHFTNLYHNYRNEARKYSGSFLQWLVYNAVEDLPPMVANA